MKPSAATGRTRWRAMSAARARPVLPEAMRLDAADRQPAQVARQRRRSAPGRARSPARHRAPASRSTGARSRKLPGRAPAIDAERRAEAEGERGGAAHQQQRVGQAFEDDVADRPGEGDGLAEIEMERAPRDRWPAASAPTGRAPSAGAAARSCRRRRRSRRYRRRPRRRAPLRAGRTCRRRRSAARRCCRPAAAEEDEGAGHGAADVRLRAPLCLSASPPQGGDWLAAFRQSQRRRMRGNGRRSPPGGRCPAGQRGARRTRDRTLIIREFSQRVTLPARVRPVRHRPARVVGDVLHRVAGDGDEAPFGDVDQRQVVGDQLLELLVELGARGGVERLGGLGDQRVELGVGVAALVGERHAVRDAALHQDGGRDRRVAAEHRRRRRRGRRHGRCRPPSGARRRRC